MLGSQFQISAFEPPFTTYLKQAQCSGQCVGDPQGYLVFSGYSQSEDRIYACAHHEAVFFISRLLAHQLVANILFIPAAPTDARLYFRLCLCRSVLKVHPRMCTSEALNRVSITAFCFQSSSLAFSTLFTIRHGWPLQRIHLWRPDF